MRSARVWTVASYCLWAAACGTDPTQPQPVPAVTSFSFLEGSWSIESVFIADDGSEERTAGQSIVRSALGDRARKERWVGMRGGTPVELWVLFVPSENSNHFLVVRGDGGAGTFDVLEGQFTSSVGSFSSRPGTRPDGGLIRETFSDIEKDHFTWRAEHSGDGGQTWNVYWTMDYTRNATGTEPPPGPALAAGCTDPEYRQFDFWEGNWNVGAATNRLRILLGGCILEENWSGAEMGTSFNMYDSRSGLWNQVWTDTNDYSLVISGGLDSGRMVLQGPRLTTTQRITWTPNADGTVRQVGQGSTDGGQSWTTSYDLTYVKQ